MEKNKLLQITSRLSFCFLLIMYSRAGFSQCTPPTHTDPDTNYVQPKNQGFKTNTFKWWGDSSRIFPFNSIFTMDTFVFSPFFQGYSNEWTAGIQSSQDNKPQDGWELVKQDLGFFYGNGKWNGQKFGYPSGYLNRGSSLIILYNKYQAKLRVFVILPFNNLTDAGGLAIALSFQNPKGNSSALFNNYNSIQRTLDFSSTTNIYGLATLPFSGSVWTYADFPMSYDPCTCFLNSDLQVDFYTINAAQTNLTVSGRSIGKNVPIATFNGSSDGIRGSEYRDHYLSSISIDDSGYIDNLVQDFFDVRSFGAELADRKDSTNWFSSYNTVLRMGTELKNISSSAGKDSAIQIANVIGYTVGNTSAVSQDYFNLFSSSADNPSAGLIVMSSQELIGGNLWGNNLNSAELVISNPSSPDAVYAPESEYLQVSTNSYPMYNQPMGLFALLKAPEIDQTFWHHKKEREEVLCQPFVEHTDIGYTYKLSSDIQYVLNPIVDPVATKIFAYLKIEGFPTLDIDQKICGSLQDPLAFKDDSTSNLNFAGITKDGHKIYTTPVLPIECLSGIVAFDGFSKNKTIYSLINDPVFDSAISQKQAEIVFSIAYVFKPDEYGKVHSSTQLLRYPVSIVQQPRGTPLMTTAAVISLPFPTNLSIPATTYTDGVEIFSYGTITITGDLKNHSGAIKYITAESGFNVQSGVKIDSTIILQQGPGPLHFCDQAPIPPTNVDSNYCLSSHYKANQGMRNYTEETTTFTKLPDTDFNFKMFPNPTTGNCKIVVYLPEGTETLITITDLMGRVVNTIDNSWHERGVNTIQFDASTYASGMYLVRYNDSENTVVKRLVVVQQTH